MKTTNKAIAQLLINAGIEKAIYSNARKQLPENAGFRLQTFKNEYHNRLSIYAATTTWNQSENVATMINQISAVLTQAGIAFTTRNDSIEINR